MMGRSIFGRLFGTSKPVAPAPDIAAVLLKVAELQQLVLVQMDTLRELRQFTFRAAASLLTQSEGLRTSQENLRKLVWRHLVVPPNIPEIDVISESEFMSYINKQLTLADPRLTDSDVVIQQVTISQANAEPLVVKVPALADQVVQFSVLQDTVYTITLSYIDDAGNSSNPSITEFVAIDDVAPLGPDGVGTVKSFSETASPLFATLPAAPEAVEPVVVEPTVVEPTVVEPTVVEPTVVEPVAPSSPDGATGPTGPYGE